MNADINGIFNKNLMHTDYYGCKQIDTIRMNPLKSVCINICVSKSESVLISLNQFYAEQKNV